MKRVCFEIFTHNGQRRWTDKKQKHNNACHNSRLYTAYHCVVFMNIQAKRKLKKIIILVGGCKMKNKFYWLKYFIDQLNSNSVTESIKHEA